MAEVSFHKEIESLRLGAGDTFYGEGILAVTKALLQSGVAYVGGYQGAPVSHLLDVLVQSEELLSDLGIHLETCTNEAAAAAMLAASINYPAARRRHLEVDRRHQRRRRRAFQSRLARRAGRRADHRRRGLRRGRQRHPGAHARIRREVVAVADRSAARPADPGAQRGEGLRAVGGLQHACHAGAAHPRLPHVRQLPRQGQRGGRAFGEESPRTSALQLRPAEPSAGDLPPGGRQERPAPAGGAQVHRRQQAERAAGTGRRRHRHHRAGRPVQRAERPPRARRPQRRRWRGDGADAGAQRRASAGAGGDRRLLRRQEGRAGGRGGRARFHRAGGRPDPAQGRSADQAVRQGRAAHGGGVHAPRRRQGAGGVLRVATAAPCPRSSDGSPGSRRSAPRSTRRWAHPCRRGRRRSAPAARSGRCSPP